MLSVQGVRSLLPVLRGVNTSFPHPDHIWCQLAGLAYVILYRLNLGGDEMKVVDFDSHGHGGVLEGGDGVVAIGKRRW